MFARARRVCLALPETSETSSHGHPNFQAGKKTFCAFEIHHGRPSIALKLPIVEFEAEVAAGLMFATPYGRGAWTSLWVASGHAKKGATGDPWNTEGVPAANRVAGGHAKEGATATPGTPKVFQQQTGVDESVNWKELTALVRRAYDGVANKRMRAKC